MIKVRAEFYSSLKDIVDASALELTLPEDATVNDLVKRLQASYPELRDFRKSMLFGIGVEFVDPGYRLANGDTVSIMPPVQGG